MLTLTTTITPAQSGRTVEQIARTAFSLSKTKLKRAKFTENGLLLDGLRVRSNAPVAAGQRLTVNLPELEEGELVPTQGEVHILYEDDWLLVIDKPAGLAVHPGPGHYADTLGNYLTWLFRQRGEPFVLRLVNRLDIGTSGLLIAAKSPLAHEKLMDLLHTDQFRRRYLALAEGRPPLTSGTIDLPLRKKPDTLNQYEVHKDGLPARTDYTLLNVYNGVSLLSLILHTGRTHQIRVHCAALGCPLLGDPVYGHGGELGRPALHSHEITLVHPFTGERMVWRSELPKELEQCVIRNA